jgi:hypothetical protein
MAYDRSGWPGCSSCLVDGCPLLTPTTMRHPSCAQMPISTCPAGSALVVSLAARRGRTCLQAAADPSGDGNPDLRPPSITVCWADSCHRQRFVAGSGHQPAASLDSQHMAAHSSHSNAAACDARQSLAAQTLRSSCNRRWGQRSIDFQSTCCSGSQPLIQQAGKQFLNTPAA